MRPEERKKNTESLLAASNIPFVDWLPLTEDESIVEPKCIREVGERIICLFCLAGTAFNEGDKGYIDALNKYELWSALSKKETTYLSHPTYGDTANIDAKWRIEALYLLLWSVGLVSELPYPPSEANIEEFIDLLPRSTDDPSIFLKSLEQRPISEIMDAADLIYRLHWATKRPGCPSEIDSGVVREWHHAINWLTNYDGKNWDDVTTDT